MIQPARLFVETTWHPAFRYGGWGIVRQGAEGLQGWAGGERNTAAARIDLMALTAALQGLQHARRLLLRLGRGGAGQGQGRRPVQRRHPQAEPGQAGAGVEGERSYCG
jgi:hypothetical protein